MAAASPIVRFPLVISSRPLCLRTTVDDLVSPYIRHRRDRPGLFAACQEPAEWNLRNVSIAIPSGYLIRSQDADERRVSSETPVYSSTEWNCGSVARASLGAVSTPTEF